MYNLYNRGNVAFEPFTPSTGSDLYSEMYGQCRIMETDPQGISYITYTYPYSTAPEPESTEVSVHIQLDDLKVVAEFDYAGTVEEVRDDLASDLSGYADECRAIVVGPLIIPSRHISAIRFASVRSTAEASKFSVHLYGDGTE